MTAEYDEQLERALASLTAWPGPTPRLWQRALKATKNAKSPAASRWAWLLQRRRLAGPIAACIVVVGLGIAIATYLPNQEQYGGFAVSVAVTEAERYRATEFLAPLPTPSEKYSADTDYAVMDASQTAYGYLGEADGPDLDGRPVAGTGRAARSSYGGVALVRSAGEGEFGPKSPASLVVGQEMTTTSDNSPQDRQIIRKATIELLTDDVRAAFGKVSMTLNEGLGEFVQESSLTGSGEDAQAEITIRVAADRLSEVMNALRGLGRVQREQVAGQDVTAQVVDIEARLRNEQRVEVELLDLLEKRKDAPLKEILDLRAALGNVRGQIEQLTAQRQRLGHLVSLSTVLVIIRTEKTKPQSIEFSILQYFGEGIRTAWRKGLVFLADTTGGLLSILIGGLVWWILLAIAIVAIRRRCRRAA